MSLSEAFSDLGEESQGLGSAAEQGSHNDRTDECRDVADHQLSRASRSPRYDESDAAEAKKEQYEAECV